MTLQDYYDNNDKEGFLSLAWTLCAFRKITHHEFCELKDVYVNWEYFKSKHKKGRVILGNLGTDSKE